MQHPTPTQIGPPDDPALHIQLSRAWICPSALLMPVCVGYQCQKPGSLYGGRQLSLIPGFGPGNAAGDNLAGLRDIRF